VRAAAPAIVWPNGSLGIRDVAGVTYSAEQFFHKNINRRDPAQLAPRVGLCFSHATARRFSAVYSYGAAQEIFGTLKDFVGRSQGAAACFQTPLLHCRSAADADPPVPQEL
jgi:hypothetical protein